jgi:hypothetical protein
MSKHVLIAALGGLVLGFLVACPMGIGVGYFGANKTTGSVGAAGPDAKGKDAKVKKADLESRILGKWNSVAGGEGSGMYAARLEFGKDGSMIDATKTFKKWEFTDESTPVLIITHVTRQPMTLHCVIDGDTMKLVPVGLDDIDKNRAVYRRER